MRNGGVPLVGAHVLGGGTEFCSPHDALAGVVRRPVVEGVRDLRAQVFADHRLVGAEAVEGEHHGFGLDVALTCL